MWGSGEKTQQNQGGERAALPDSIEVAHEDGNTQQ